MTTLLTINKINGRLMAEADTSTSAELSAFKSSISDDHYKKYQFLDNSSNVFDESFPHNVGRYLKLKTDHLSSQSNENHF